MFDEGVVEVKSRGPTVVGAIMLIVTCVVVILALGLCICVGISQEPFLVSEDRIAHVVSSAEESYSFEVLSVAREYEKDVVYTVRIDGFSDVKVDEAAYLKYLHGYNHVSRKVETVTFFVDSGLFGVDFEDCFGYGYQRFSWPWEEIVVPFSVEEIAQIHGAIMEKDFSLLSVLVPVHRSWRQYHCTMNSDV